MKYKYINLASGNLYRYRVLKISVYVIVTILVFGYTFYNVDARIREIVIIEQEIINAKGDIALPVGNDMTKEKSYILQQVCEQIGFNNIHGFNLIENKFEVSGVCKNPQSLKGISDIDGIRDLSIDSIKEKSKNKYIFKISFGVGDISEI